MKDRITTLKDNNKGKNLKNLRTIVRSNKLIEALSLPIVMNVNPRSIYNKVNEFHNFVIEELVDIVAMSESWERIEQPLGSIIKLPNHTVISNPHQRRGIGGRPALIINNEKYNIKNLTQSFVEVPWGVEATWALVSPKQQTSNSKIKRIAVCSLYSKPDSRKKSLLLDHISHAFNLISTKYGDGLHFIIAGDTNDLKLDNILNLSHNMKQLVMDVTRLNPPAMLDPIISTLGDYYQRPVCLPPLDPDPGTDGRPSDHLIVIMKPIKNLNSTTSRSYRKIKVRPLTKSGMVKFREWIENKDWAEVIKEESVDKKAETLQNIVLNKLDEVCPERNIKIASDDEPWFSEKLKKLQRKKARLFRKNRNSEQYKKMKKKYEIEITKAKKDFKIRTIDDALKAKSAQWYSKLKKITKYDRNKSENVEVDEISHLPQESQAEAIADSFSAISNEYEKINKDEIVIPPFNQSSIPQFKPHKVMKYLRNIKTNKSTAPGDIPPRIIKEFAFYLSIPLSNIINAGLRVGHWPKIYKRETITPIPKQFPPETRDMLRPIANLCNFNKIMEKIISEMVISDMTPKLDPGQYGNQENKSIQHYLVRFINRILTSLDKNSKGEVNAALCLFIDWKQAYSRQCHTLGVKSFLKNGVRPSLIPILISYFEDREMKVKWKGVLSESRKLPGGGAMGASLGNWEYLSQSNDSADCVPEEDRFKFVDDLSTLEIINLMTIGLSSLLVKNHVPNDIPSHGQFISNENLKSQEYLNKINSWTEKMKMQISEKKTKAMIFNFTDNYQFSTRLNLKGTNIEIVDKMKILGTIINNQLSWDDNCNEIIKKVNSRMQLIRSLQSFGASANEMVHFWQIFCRSVLEQSCVVWGSSLTQENIENLERTQKSFAKLVLREKYNNYNDALKILNLDTLENRRKELTKRFAMNGIMSNTLNDLFPRNDPKHKMERRKKEKFKVNFANTERLKNASVITMQNLLNQENND